MKSLFRHIYPLATTILLITSLGGVQIFEMGGRRKMTGVEGVHYVAVRVGEHDDGGVGISQVGRKVGETENLAVGFLRGKVAGHGDERAADQSQGQAERSEVPANHNELHQGRRGHTARKTL